ncbi:MAG: FtsX-like permease family protein [Nautiliaceae bacterium]
MESFKIAFRNLIRMGRRTFLTGSLIAIGVVFVVLYITYAESFKNSMIAQITDSVMGELQIHKKGYVSSLDALPLDKNMGPKVVKKIEKKLNSMPEVYSYSERLKFGGMISNYTDSTNIRLNGIDPEMEAKTLPLLKERLTGHLPRVGEIVIPELISKGLHLKIGDVVVLVATNKNGSMNAKTLKISGIVGIVSGPGGRDGYINLKDARKLLRIKKAEVNEIVIKLKNPDMLQKANKELVKFVKSVQKPKLEVHTWVKLSPFSNIVKMLDLMTFSIEIILISIVLVSILNVMIMSVYERIKQIGTMKAMGTPKSFIVSMFVNEGMLLGVFGFIIGVVLSVVLVFVIGDIHYSFGRQSNLVLVPVIDWGSVVSVGIMVMIISILASLYPAVKAASLKPIDALRS